MALSVKYNYNRQSLGINVAFLNASLNMAIYATQPEGFVVPEYESHLYLLHKAMHGLRKSSCEWDKLLESFLVKVHFIPSWADPGLYIYRKDGKSIFILE